MPLDTRSPVLASMNLRLTYADCDPMGIAYYAAYYPWMERVYNEWTVAGGHTPDRMQKLWGATHISRASGCEYFVPGMLFDSLTCEMRLANLGRTSVTMAHDFTRESDGIRLVQGHIVFVFIDADGRPTPIPDGMKKVLRAAGAEIE